MIPVASQIQPGLPALDIQHKRRCAVATRVRIRRTVAVRFDYRACAQGSDPSLDITGEAAPKILKFVALFLRPTK